MNIITNELTKSPIFNLSLCSLENFHTSFITWVGNEYPKEFITIFSNKDYSKADSIQFKTQVNCGQSIKLDLQIVINKGQTTEYIIVENKLKSFPTDEQLNKYTNYFKNEKASFILLSLAPKFDLPNMWSYISYSVLANKMKSIFNDKFNYRNAYNKFLIEDYINVIDNISKAFQFEDSKKFDFYNINEEIENLHLRDIYVKCRGAKFANILKENLNNCDVYSAFHHGKNTIDIFLERNDIYDFRIQIEGNQFRYCFLPLWSDDEINKEKIANDLLNNQLWFNNTETHRKEFCKYGKNFIYRYQTIEKLFAKNKLCDVTYQEIINYVNDEINRFNKNHQYIDLIINKYKK